MDIKEIFYGIIMIIGGLLAFSFSYRQYKKLKEKEYSPNLKETKEWPYIDNMEEIDDWGMKFTYIKVIVVALFIMFLGAYFIYVEFSKHNIN